MSQEDGFLRAMLTAPEDTSIRLIYADWLEERGDPRGEFLRIDAMAARPNGGGTTDPVVQRRLEELRTALDPAWLTFVTNLGRPFCTRERNRHFFDCEPSQLPFTERIGLRGRIMTYESQFRGDRSWEPTLPKDLQMLCHLELSDCAYGAGSIPVHPFICELGPKRGPLTGADVLKALKAHDFRSRHIQNLEATRIPYPGYHPGNGSGIDNDEIHNSFSGQYIFQKGDEDSEEVDEFSGAHGVLKRSAVDGQLWYVLLHITPEQVAEYLFSSYVVLFAVGRSPNGDRLLGAVTHQVCHNLCD